MWPFYVITPLRAVPGEFNIHKDPGAVSKKHLYLKNVLGVVIKKESKTRQAFKKSISRCKFKSHSKNVTRKDVNITEY